MVPYKTIVKPSAATLLTMNTCSLVAVVVDETKEPELSILPNCKLSPGKITPLISLFRPTVDEPWFKVAVIAVTPAILLSTPVSSAYSAAASYGIDGVVNVLPLNVTSNLKEPPIM